jgi:nicotinamide mononucleotide transporter
MVLCNLRVNPWPGRWPSPASLLYALLFCNSKLYGEAGLQFVFVAVAAWGWWQWLRGRGRRRRRAARAGWIEPRRGWRLLPRGAAWPLLALLLRCATDSDVPWWTPAHRGQRGRPVAAGPQVRGELARLAGRQPVSIGLFAYKGLWLTAAALRAVRGCWRCGAGAPGVQRAGRTAMAEPLVIAVLGAESTGKTTLARHWPAARPGDRPGVAPGCRNGCASGASAKAARRAPDEQAAIARTQHQRIETAAASHDVVVCDTTALMTAVYSRMVFGDRIARGPALALHAGHIG